MPMTDTERAQFVLNEYRYAVAKNFATQATYPAALEIIIETNLDEDAAQALADAYLAFEGDPQRAFFVEIDYMMTTDDFLGGLPRFILHDPRFDTDGRTYVMVECESDFFNSVTKLGLVG